MTYPHFASHQNLHRKYQKQVRDLTEWFKVVLKAPKFPTLVLSRTDYYRGVSALKEPFSSLIEEAFTEWADTHKYELSYNQMCCAFFKAIEAVGKVRVENYDNISQEEALRMAQRQLNDLRRLLPSHGSFGEEGLNSFEYTRNVVNQVLKDQDDRETYYFSDNTLVFKDADHGEFFKVVLKEPTNRSPSSVFISRYMVPGRVDIYAFDNFRGVSFTSETGEPLDKALSSLKKDLNKKPVVALIDSLANNRYVKPLATLLEQLAPKSLAFKNLQEKLSKRSKDLASLIKRREEKRKILVEVSKSPATLRDNMVVWRKGYGGTIVLSLKSDGGEWSKNGKKWSVRGYTVTFSGPVPKKLRA